MIRVFLADAAQGMLKVAGAPHHYLVHVRRVQAGQRIEVFDGRGTSFQATVEHVGGNELALQLAEPKTAPTIRSVTVLQGMPKADKLEWVIQKSSELWAQGVQPVFCEHSVVKPGDNDLKKTKRWQTIAEEASRQCGRSDVLTVYVPQPFQKALALHQGALFVLDETEETRTLSAAYRELPKHEPLRFLVGPEGGLSKSERTLLSLAGAQCVSLGDLVLRTETAALAALSIVRHLDGWLG